MRKQRSPSYAAYAANQGGKAMLNTLKGKIIAGACAAVIVGGGVTAGVIILNNSKSKTPSRPVVSASAVVSKPTNDSKSANSSNPVAQSTPAVSNGDNTLWDNISTAMDNKGNEGDFEYEPYFKENTNDPIDPNYVMVTSYSGNESDVIIPSTLGGKPVKAIHHMIWGDITSVTLPDTVTEINSGAFAGYKNLNRIVFSKNLEKIGYRAFASCSGLESVELPDGLKIISIEAFCYCRSLKSVTVPDSVELVGESAFDSVAEDCEIRYKGQVYSPEGFAELFKDNPDIY